MKTMNQGKQIHSGAQHFSLASASRNQVERNNLILKMPRGQRWLHSYQNTFHW